jgi:beta-galactosidase
VIPGGYPGAFRALLGAWSEEFRPLQAGESTSLDDGSTVREWTEDMVLAGASPVLSYVDGDGAGRPAVTRRDIGDGSAWYVSAALEADSAQRLVDGLIAELGLPRTVDAPAGVEAVRRRTTSGDALFLINHTSEPAHIPAGGVDLLTGDHTGPTTWVPAGGVVVVMEAPVE